MRYNAEYLSIKELSKKENWTDLYVDIKSIKNGDVFFECEHNENFKLIALTNSVKLKDGWYCIVLNRRNEKVTLFYSNDTDFQTPNLFYEPQNHSYSEKNELVYCIL